MSFYQKIKEYFRQGFFQGLGWSLGATIGFAIISTVLIVVLNGIGGLPVVGSQIANIIEATQESLYTRNVFDNKATSE